MRKVSLPLLHLTHLPTILILLILNISLFLQTHTNTHTALLCNLLFQYILEPTLHQFIEIFLILSQDFIVIHCVMYDRTQSPV